jgi:hypothetical protein
MLRGLAFVALLGVGLLFGLSGYAQRPEGKDRDGPPGKDRKGPPPFRLGKVLPPHAVEMLELTDRQRQQIAALEKEVRQRLEKILTTRQKKLLESMRPPGGPGGPGGKGKDGGKDREDRPERPKPEGKEEARAPAGIQWFATLQSARAEAARTGRPILLVSAAPHCAGVSGIW